ncbi:hypothetical protein K8I85_06370, partial [bacterium]|nr:hypothetical protein [bacterium]
PQVAVFDVRATTRVIDVIRRALPEGWAATTIRWDTVPRGWRGDSTCVLMELEDTTVSFDHPDGFRFHPFYKIWLLPPGWEGRMEVSSMDPEMPHAMYLGENAQFRVLARTLGPNTWPEGPDEIARAMDLATYPLSPRPEHRLDVPAMQKLFQRLDATDRGGGLDRWRRQIYGIEELDDLIYLELLTWEEHSTKRESDPTFLGDLAERETAFLSREALAAFPTKRGLYLRRVTRESFSDVIVVNPSVPGS